MNEWVDEGGHEMTNRIRIAPWATAIAAALVLSGVDRTAIADSEKDDLAVVKRAVSASAPSREQSPPPVEKIQDPGKAEAPPVEKVQEAPSDQARTGEPGDRRRRPPRAAGKEPTWLKVRVMEKGTKKGRVMVNVPLAVVRAFGEGWPEIDFQCGNERTKRCYVRISEILAALESGQDLVEIDEEDHVVRVWVE
jgi:hypothetical protein